MPERRALRFVIRLAIVVAPLLQGCAPPSAYAGGFRPRQGPAPPPSASELSRRDRDRELAEAFAPVIFHATRPSERPASWDTPARVDFDGDRIASNNEESLRAGLHPITPVVYYAVLETETHIFVIYGLYHPLDWSTLPAVFPYTWHENDMENIQVVVEKRADAGGSVVLLAAQAHLLTTLYTLPGSGISSGAVAISDRPLRLLDRDHPAIFVESGGHGIYSVTDAPGDLETSDPPTLREGVLYLYSFNKKSGAPAATTPAITSALYELLPIYDTFWAPYLDGSGTGDGKLMDGSFSYYERGLAWDHVPRHLDSDRLSGPCKSDSGILPFAFGFSLADLDLGSLFFSPAEKYAESLSIERAWSTRYLRHPYR
jgi:hypothetical protein